MSIYTTKINFEKIREQVNAAESLQIAGKDDLSKEVIEGLAKDILNV